MTMRNTADIQRELATIRAAIFYRSCKAVEATAKELEALRSMEKRLEKELEYNLSKVA